ncbi:MULTISPECIES: cysteine-rich CWC family protein [unclassified Colwellia]|jgi:hypothetical protein|uniref:cysteine-rich CWC family protein n=1 Tax=unclassified Colwellia TaxID=196834 RepID=UPI0015F53B73|nr:MULTISPECIES: cysteine-rich CWC family protein [unclassified Colwellia]MBA6234473.1 cysteine-rich CWC family protein [Colwellia sp. MB02u-7]MBA6236894.1 cysteine-rich CWC family protein [Colwellia sp. MB02u-11]MBA6299966.1 cysteine-rich CWC family protein [Colwellia sp. MB3u-22]MBA6301814.1 cysteine-rich CWC family protein [Colwellia sp. MB02u-14]MBA6312651.1 cysteine-rich CWC family protein [Colwellia sp. MB3u-64]
MQASNQPYCPLCNNQNLCGVSNTTKPCWCTLEKVPSALIQGVPDAEKGKSCICQACIKKFNLAQKDSFTLL